LGWRRIREHVAAIFGEVRLTSTITPDVVKGHLVPRTIEEQIVQLRQQLGALEIRTTQLEDDLREEISNVRSEISEVWDKITKLLNDRLAEERATFRPHRLAGFGVALRGSFFLAAANLL
jgi:hypothetical protein